MHVQGCRAAAQVASRVDNPSRIIKQQGVDAQESTGLQPRGSLQHAGSMPATSLPPPQIGFRRTVFGNLLANQPPEQPQLSKATPVTPPARQGPELKPWRMMSHACIWKSRVQIHACSHPGPSL